MSMPARCDGEGFPQNPESQALVYVQHAPVDTPTEEVDAIMLTRDGVRPFLEEIDIKEQLILYFPSDTVGLIWIEHVRDGSRDKFMLDRFGLEPYGNPEDLLAEETVLEPTENDAEEAPEALPISDMARLSLLREKIDRFLLTPQN
jgi:hypothetical protein